MKRSLTAVCMLASAIGASSIAFTNHAAAQSAETPSAPSPASAAPSAPVPSASAAPAVGPAKIAVIVFQQAVMQTNEGQRNIAQLQQKFAPKQSQLKAQNDEIESLKKQLQDSAATLSDPERESRTRTIDEKTKSLQRVAEDDQNDFNSEMNETYQSLAQKVYGIMDTYAKQQGFTLVLDASQQNSPVLWLNPATDITKAVIEAYNVKSGVAPPPPSATGGTTTTTPHTGTGTTHPTTPHPTTTRPSTTHPSTTP